MFMGRRTLIMNNLMIKEVSFNGDSLLAVKNNYDSKIFVMV